jgi:hypothetical protein
VDLLHPTVDTGEGKVSRAYHKLALAEVVITMGMRGS